MAMKLIVGLGNPGADYKQTKHNAGFWVMQAVAKELNISFNKKKFNAQIAQGKLENNDFILAKPLTYMNLSGRPVRSFVDYFKIALNDLLIVFDDVSLKLGSIRMRKSGSAGGHNGLRSVIDILGTPDISRLRFGIKSPNAKSPDLAKYVLSGFNCAEDRQLAEQTVTLAKDAVISWIRNDIDFTMNRYNVKRRENPENE